MSKSDNRKHIASLESAIEEISLSINSKKPKDIKVHYQENAVRIIKRVIEALSKQDEIDQ